MAMKFIQEPDAPEGMGRVVDPETGLDRVVYDPELARRLGGGAGAYQPEAPRELAPTEHLRDGDQLSPPEPAEPAANAWADAQRPRPAPIVRASGAPQPPPAPPDGTVLSKAKVEMGQPGYTYDKAAEEQRGADLLERTLELQRRADETDIIKREQQIELEKQKNDAATREEKAAARARRFEHELDTVVRTEINPDRIQQNQGFFGSLLGIIGKTLGYLSTPESGFGRLQADLDRRVQRDIEAQKDRRDSMISMLSKRLGSEQQAENHYRAQVNALTADIIENRLQRLGLANQYGDQIQALRDQALAYNQAARAASEGKPGSATYEFERPAPTGAAPVRLSNPTTEKLKAIGITPEAWTKGLGGKVMAGTNSPTIAQAGDTTKRIDQDIAMLEAIAAENGGKLPSKGVINIPESLVPTLSRLGYEPGMDAEKIGQILNGYVNQQARSYGGAITESDREAAKSETGESTQGTLFFLQRLRDKNNDAIRSALAQQFPGAGQQVFDLFLGETGGNEGVPKAAAKPFAKRNAPEEKKPEPPKSDVEQRQAKNRREVVRRLGEFFGGTEAPFQAPRYGGAK